MKGITKEYKFFLFMLLSPLGAYISYEDIEDNHFRFYAYIIKILLDILFTLYLFHKNILIFFLVLLIWIISIISGSLSLDILKINFIWIDKKLFNLDELISNKESIYVEYKGLKDSNFKKRNILIKSYEYKNKKVYLNVYDLDKKENRIFRKDRVR